MAYTPDDLARLERKIAAANQRVQHGDKSVEHAPMKDMVALRDRMKREIESQTTGRRLPVAGFASFRRG